MEPTTEAIASPLKHQHKRSTSSVLKSIMPRNHQRDPSTKAISSVWNEEHGKFNNIVGPKNQLSAPDHANAMQHLREDSGNRNRIPPPSLIPVDIQKENVNDCGENRKMANSTSFMSFVDKEKPKSSKQKPEKKERQMKKSKSYTSLSALLSRPRSKSEKVESGQLPIKRDNERQTRSVAPPPPIWAQFATQGIEEPASTTKVPLNDSFTAAEIMPGHTGKEHSPCNQRNNQEFQQPTMSRKSMPKPRPKSDCLSNGPSPASFTEIISGLPRSSQEKGPADKLGQRQQTLQSKDLRLSSYHEDKPSSRGQSRDTSKVKDESYNPSSAQADKASRVKAAVAAFDSKVKELPKEPVRGSSNAALDASAVENAFETLLVSPVLI